jgi:hypothetical protein
VQTAERSGEHLFFSFLSFVGGYRWVCLEAVPSLFSLIKLVPPAWSWACTKLYAFFVSRNISW